MEKKLCYCLLYTGNNEKILARTILTYETIKNITKKDVWILTDSENNKKELEKYCDKVYIPKNIEKYFFTDDKILDGRSYPNIYLKFSVYELKKFSYTHVLFLDSDVVIGNENLIDKISLIENEILFTESENILCHRYDPRYNEKDPMRLYICCCIAFNIEKDISDEILKFKIDGKTEEWMITNWAINNNQKINELPIGLLSNVKDLKYFSIFHHTGGRLYYSVLKTRFSKLYLRYKEICETLEKNKKTTLLLF